MFELHNLGNKPAGTFSTWFRKYRRAWQEGKDADVPCGKCTACCRSYVIDVRPFENHEGLDTQIVDGKRQIKQRPDGSCVHLGPSGCTVRDKRPLTCRMFDCRTMFFAGLVPTKGPMVDAIEQWRPEFKRRTDKVEMMALRLSAAKLVAEAKDGADGGVEEMSIRVPAGYPEYLEPASRMLDAFEAASPAERNRLLEFTMDAAKRAAVHRCAACGETTKGGMSVKGKVVPVCNPCWLAGKTDASIRKKVYATADLRPERRKAVAGAQ